MSPAGAAVKTEVSKTSQVVTRNVNAILQALMANLKQMEIADVRLGKPTACREGWKTEGYAVYARVHGMVSGDLVLGVPPLMARKAVGAMLSKKMQISDFEFRLAIQMLANEALVSALDVLAQVNIRVSLTAPQVYSRFEWTKTPMCKVPMIQIPLLTACGVCDLAFNIQTA